MLLGTTANIVDTNLKHINDEVKNGHYELILSISAEKIRIIDKFLKNYFKSYRKDDEVYDSQISQLVIPYIQSIGINYKILSDDEIRIIECTGTMLSMPNIRQIKYSINAINRAQFIQKLRDKKVSAKE